MVAHCSSVRARTFTIRADGCFMHTERMKALIRLLLLSSAVHALAASSPATISSPAGPGSAEPFLTRASDGAVLMSWLEPANEKRFALRWAKFNGKSWSVAQTIAERDDFFVNWADFPSIVQTSDGTMFAHWLQKSGTSVYAYDIKVVISRDQGKTWSKPLLLNTDGKKAEHGFVSLAPVAPDAIAAVWLDGREFKEGTEEGEMTLRFATVDRKANLGSEAMLDGRVCDCCTTALTKTARGLVALYRDRSPDEIRDISVVRRVSGKWTAPRALHRDDWKIAGCPVNGPQVAANGQRVVAAWFTSPASGARVNVAFSSNAGETFGAPARVDLGSPLGRVDVVLLDNGEALVTWIDTTAGSARILAQRVGGAKKEPVTVAATSVSRSSGFPRVTVAGGRAYVAWTETSDPKRIRIATLELR